MQQHRVRVQPHRSIIPQKKNLTYYLELLGEEGTIRQKLEIAASVCQIRGLSEPSVKRTLKEAEAYLQAPLPSH
jgi:hypothetical protein